MTFLFLGSRIRGHSEGCGAIATEFPGTDGLTASWAGDHAGGCLSLRLGLARLALRGYGQCYPAQCTHLGMFIIHRSAILTVDGVGSCGVPRSCSGLQAVLVNCTPYILIQPVVADASRKWKEPERGEKEPCNESPNNGRIV